MCEELCQWMLPVWHWPSGIEWDRDTLISKYIMMTMMMMARLISQHCCTRAFTTFTATSAKQLDGRKWGLTSRCWIGYEKWTSSSEHNGRDSGAGIILRMGSANDKPRYNATSSFTAWAKHGKSWRNCGPPPLCGRSGKFEGEYHMLHVYCLMSEVRFANNLSGNG